MIETAQALASQGCSDLNVYLANAGPDDLVLYRGSGPGVARIDLDRLRDHGVSTLYVETGALHNHDAYLEENLDKLLLGDSLEPVAKAEIVHYVGRTIAQNLIASPHAGETLARTSRFVDEIVDCVLAKQGVGRYMMHMACHHRSTASHMMIVSMMAVMLGAKVYGRDAGALHDLGMAGMLHDLGKMALDPSLLNKPSRLTSEESGLIQQHPVESVRLIGGAVPVTPAVSQLVIQHHERVDGRGYPLGLTGDQLEVGSKILAIADTYHAVTGPRSYRAPLTPAEANRVLNSVAGRQLDPELLDCWNSLCAARGTRPPEAWAVRGNQHEEDELSTKHEHRVQPSGHNGVRHRPKRFACNGKIGALCVYAGRLEGLSSGPNRFDCPVQDLSRSGLCLRTDHALFRGEVIHVLLRGRRQSVWVQGVVAWCRQCDDRSGFRCGVRLCHRVNNDQVGVKTEVKGLSDTAANSA